jgi:hypothetical protein
MQKIKNFLTKKSKTEILALLCYPLGLLLWKPIRLAGILWNARVLAAWKWSQ